MSRAAAVYAAFAVVVLFIAVIHPGDVAEVGYRLGVVDIRGGTASTEWGNLAAYLVAGGLLAGIAHLAGRR